ncbi:NAD(P)H-binding protein [Actinosynnema sp. CA-248983]
MTVLVTGATGNVGAEVVRALVRAEVDLRALVRSPSPLDVPQVVGDLNDPASLSFFGVEALFLLPGYRDMPGILAEASRAGVRRVVLLSSPAVTASDTGNAVSEYMIRSEEAVRSSGLEWTVLRPNGFMSNTLRWLPQLSAGDVVRDAFATVPVAMIDPYDIGAVACRALTSAEFSGQVLMLSGPEPLLPADRVRVLGEVLDRELTFVGLSDEQARAEMSAAMPAEYVHAFFSFYSEGTLDESRLYPTVEQVTGRPPRDFRTWARAHAGEFATT